ncbi:MAG: ABC transporter ATP-binding protein [Brooklawnia sp.]|uniref:ABC transporter ATP-binding protein n=1 Tax=Brooklawnia sp. TaxID=2699740 RepID=UPI003C71D944
MQSLLRLLGLARELWPYYLGIALAALATAGTALLTPFIIKAATDEIVSQIRGEGGGVRALLWLAVALLVVELVSTAVTNVGGYLGDVMSVKLRAILSSRYYAKMLTLPQHYFDGQLTGTVINRLTRSIAETSQFFQMFANNFLPLLLTVLAVLVVTATYSVWLTLLLVVIYPIFMWLTALTSKHWQPLEREKNQQFDIAGGRFAEAIGQIRVVKSFTAELRELRVFNDRYTKTVDVTHGQSRYWHLMDVARRGAFALIFFAIYAIIFTSTASGAFTLGAMVLLIQLVAMAKQPVSMMSYLVDSSQRAIAGSNSYLEALDELPEPHAPFGPEAALSFTRPAQTEAAVAADLAPWRVVDDAPALSFDHVSFSYDGASDVLQDVTFSVAPGERVAFVGESGGGKTTLVNLLLGLYRPDSGVVQVGGGDVTRLPLQQLRGQIGVVFQDAALFSGTIRENIAYGRPDAAASQIEDAAQRANAHEFVARLTKGYDSEIGERGIKLSGGQKQRVAVARAILKDAPLLVLDEATSALDSKAERLVQAGLEALMANRTTLIIAHRLSTISSVDRIITLRDGRVDEIGSPEELARSGGIYAELLALQASATKADRKRLHAYDITG